jgi:chorismate lyase
MNQTISPYLSAINEITWQNIEHFSFPSEYVKHWLLEQGSLSKRLKANCQNLTVQIHLKQWQELALLDADERELLCHPVACLLRQVVLCGDDTPWVIGHSLIPQMSADDQDCDLFNLGELPLGDTIFKAQAVARDTLQLALLNTSEGILYARRSRLWMNHKPMLVTELFLPLAPIYQ